jgi:hypothetical protein
MTDKLNLLEIVLMFDSILMIGLVYVLLTVRRVARSQKLEKKELGKYFS